MKRKNYKKIALVLGVSFVFLFTAGISYSKIVGRHNTGKESISQNKDGDKKEPEKVINYVGTNEEGKKYTYDAKKVEKMLNKYDYSNDGKKLYF